MLSFSKSGKENKSPVIYCELTSPRRVYSPAESCPSVFKGNCSCCGKRTPWASIASRNGVTGRLGSRPCPINVPFLPSAETSGSKNRKVEPLSPQSSDTSFGVSQAFGYTVITPSENSALAPSAARHAAVA